MQGVVPAAGEGTRLRPLTDDRPKGLVEVGGQPLLAHVFETLVDLGVEELVVITGYRGEQLVEHFGNAFEGVPVRYAEQAEPAGLADAVLTAEDLVDGDFVVLNGDNVVDADLRRLVEHHRTTDADATLLVEAVTPERATEGGTLRFDDDGTLAGVVEKPDLPPSTGVTRGCQVYSPAIFPACHLIQPSATGEYELSRAVDLLLAAGRPVETVPLEGRCVNVNDHHDLAAAEGLLEG